MVLPMKAIIGIIFILIFCSSCVEVKDHLTINADGSGTVFISTSSKGSSSGLLMARQFFKEGASKVLNFPPMQHDDFKKLFPGNDFTIIFNDDPGDKEGIIRASIEFKDINKLLQSPYAAAHALSVKRTINGKLEVKVISGLQSIADAEYLFMDNKDTPGGIFGVREFSKDYSMKFSITLPSLINNVNSNTITWLTSRDTINSIEEAGVRFYSIHKASCSDKDIKFIPKTPLRMNLGNLKDIKEGTFSNNSLDINKEILIKAVKAIPVMLKISRYFDISGEDNFYNNNDNAASFIGALVLPVELAPFRWGRGELKEIRDDLGKNYLPKKQSFSRKANALNSIYKREQAKVKEKQKTATRFISFSFKQPVPEARSLKVIHGTIPLKYQGRTTLVKLTGEIPAIKSNENDFIMTNRVIIGSDKLKKHGLVVTLNSVSKNNQITTFALKQKGEEAIIDIQVYDRNGKPWTTILRLLSPGQDNISFMIAGEPEPPLSLSLLISGGPKFEIPFSFNDVSLFGE
jgi:hypothetical protein